jgi:hypothetical protein
VGKICINKSPGKIDLPAETFRIQSGGQVPEELAAYVADKVLTYLLHHFPLPKLMEAAEGS